MLADPLDHWLTQISILFFQLFYLLTCPTDQVVDFTLYISTKNIILCLVRTDQCKLCFELGDFLVIKFIDLLFLVVEEDLFFGFIELLPQHWALVLFLKHLLIELLPTGLIGLFASLHLIPEVLIQFDDWLLVELYLILMNLVVWKMQLQLFGHAFILLLAVNELSL